MDIEEKMIYFLLNEATEMDIENFFGYVPNILNEDEIMSIISQMPDEEFDSFVKKFQIDVDSIKL